MSSRLPTEGEAVRQRKQAQTHASQHGRQESSETIELIPSIAHPCSKQDISLHAKSSIALSNMNYNGALSKLTKGDKQNIALLVCLYLLQGIPIGLAFGSVPFLLKQHLSFSDIAIFSFAQYPYSLKILWSPIVDAVYLGNIGRRKSWIIPAQVLCGLLFLTIGQSIDTIIVDPELDIYYFTSIFVLLIICAATQDIAVDGWALELLPPEHREYASTCQTIGLNSGYFLSFTVFLSFNSAEFCNRFIRSEPSELGLLQLGSYMQFWGLLSILVSLWLLVVKKEQPTKVDMTVHESYSLTGLPLSDISGYLGRKVVPGFSAYPSMAVCTGNYVSARL
ncbi:hypothetical protein SARC_01560 [Sphaeroforma arctica JP610]|uniref:Acetyl-coenzyme A transporter 1 n=1 Tax=Sphaeroforma arctica JP610 TaxID=667725 RepID=A0A0L0GDG9_9EUKA|nr:hypothetical protein SARC_01560 [Sphaeroforma arctica JP610]KNC86298.1 hypothetical protein SARC_01560 [Sphaeroforma arctica JP610]|eukprot:XP_014160200.1 hypothetical protein SARC_01560 [Sphaeroforma arctica JP610]